MSAANELEAVKALAETALLRVDASLPTIMDAMEWVTADQSRALALVQYALEKAREALEQAQAVKAN